MGSSNLQVMMDLQLALNSKQPLELMTTYKGVPVINRAAIKSIGEELVTLIAEPAVGLVSLRNQTHTTILGSEYFDPASASIVQVKLDSREVVLRDFAYLGERLAERRRLRVEPQSTTMVALKLDVIETLGEIADLSLNGVGIRIRARNDDLRVKPGKQVQLRYELPEGAIQITGRILGSARLSGFRRISVHFNPNRDQKNRIYQYLVARREQIDHEMEKEYHEWMHEAANSQAEGDDLEKTG